MDELLKGLIEHGSELGAFGVLSLCFAGLILAVYRGELVLGATHRERTRERDACLKRERALQATKAEEAKALQAEAAAMRREMDELHRSVAELRERRAEERMP